MTREGVGISTDLLPRVSARLNLSDEVKPPAVAMETGIRAVRLINFGRFLVIDAEHFEEPSHAGWVSVLKRHCEIAAQRARTVRGTALRHLRVALASGVCIVFDPPLGDVGLQSAREFYDLST